MLQHVVTSHSSCTALKDWHKIYFFKFSIIFYLHFVHEASSYIAQKYEKKVIKKRQISNHSCTLRVLKSEHFHSMMVLFCMVMLILSSKLILNGVKFEKRIFQ